MSAIVNNDGAVTLAATAACWWMVWMTRGAWSVERNVSHVSRELFILGALAGIATLCKLSGLGLLLPALFTAIFPPRSTLHAPRLPALLAAASLFAGFFLLTTPWLIFNQIHYGNPLAWDQVRAANAALLRQPPLGITEIIARIPQVLESYWGVLGIELHYPNWVNGVFYALLMLAVLGCIVAVIRHKSQVTSHESNIGTYPSPTPSQFSILNSQFITLLLWLLTLLGSYTLWLRSYVGTENGRLILPGAAPIAVLVVLGWMAWVPARWQRGFALGIGGGLFVLALITPFWIIRPAFAAPTFLSDAARAHLPAHPTATFNGQVTLLHAEVAPAQQDELPITLYWQSQNKIDQSYRVDLRVIDIDGMVIGALRTLPYHGQFATTQWPLGSAFRDDYRVAVHSSKPTAARVELRLYQQYPQPGFVAVDGQGESVLIGRVRVGPLQTLPVSPKTLAHFGGVIDLAAVNIDSNSNQPMEFIWLCRAAPTQDYTLFVHVFDAHGALINQFDGQPNHGDSPTHLWAPGDTLHDRRADALPPPAARIEIGWYDAQTGARLPATRPDGTPWPNDSVTIWERPAP